ncbi:hypothetical protein EDD57_1151 [Baia soyae]|uniref:Uncharacterized protein n=1 Tax=Baia soyae TaxID=1544746 RepID=A0A4R2RYS0_9BACL|nr:hypothetical protein EDD57_1151 [Baia soyae]
MDSSDLSEPPSAEPHARWCERSGVNHPLLLDYVCLWCPSRYIEFLFIFDKLFIMQKDIDSHKSYVLRYSF